MAKTATSKRRKANTTPRGAVGHLAMFDRSHLDPIFRVKFTGTPIDKVQHITRADYQPRGTTPLRDAAMEMILHLDRAHTDQPDAVHVGLLLDETGSMQNNRDSVIQGYNDFVDGIRDVTPDDEGGRVLCVIMTDGLENASTQTSVQQLQDAIMEREAIGWTFIYLGSNQDAWAVGHAAGFSGMASGQTVSYDSSPEGTASVLAATTTDAADWMANPAAYRQRRASSSVRSLDAKGNETVNTPTPKTKPYGDVEEALRKTRR